MSLLLQFSCSVVPDSLQPHESQHTRPPCPSQTPGVHSNSCPSSQWCHPAISFSFDLFSSCPQSSQHQGIFQRVNSLHEMAMEFQLQHQSFQWIKLGRVSGGSVVKNLPASARDMGLIPGPGRSYMLILEDPTCLRATKPLCHSSWACALEREPQLSLCAATVEAWAPKTCAPQQEKPP